VDAVRAAAVLLLASGCASIPNSSILGRWDFEGGQSGYVFSDDGTVEAFHLNYDPIHGHIASPEMMWRRVGATSF